MAKRQYGTGTIKEKNGTLFIGFRPEPGGKQIWERVGRIADGVTRRDAEALLEERRVEARKGLISANRLTLLEAATGWRDQRAFASLAPKTREQEDTALDCHLLPAFGNDRLDKISPDRLRRYIQKKRSFPPGHPRAVPVAGKQAEARSKPLGATAVRQQIQTLNKVFEWAIDQGEAMSNPCTRVNKADLKPATREVAVFEIEEVKALLRSAECEEQRAIILLMAGCGLRIGEVLGLKATDFDASKRTLHVQRTIRRDGGRTVLSDRPKTSSSDRFLVLDPPVATAIATQIKRLQREGRFQEGLLFPNQRGRLRTAENFRGRDWKRLLKRAGLALDRSPHALRHTFASELIQARRSDTDIAAKMGHKNAQITRVVYAKSFERVKATEAKVVDLYLDESGTHP